MIQSLTKYFRCAITRDEYEHIKEHVLKTIDIMNRNAKITAMLEVDLGRLKEETETYSRDNKVLRDQVSNHKSIIVNLETKIKDLKGEVAAHTQRIDNLCKDKWDAQKKLAEEIRSVNCSIADTNSRLEKIEKSSVTPSILVMTEDRSKIGKGKLTLKPNDELTDERKADLRDEVLKVLREERKKSLEERVKPTTIVDDMLKEPAALAARQAFVELKEDQKKKLKVKTDAEERNKSRELVINHINAVFKDKPVKKVVRRKAK